MRLSNPLSSKGSVKTAIALILAIALLLPNMAIPVQAGGSNNGEIKKLEGIAIEIENLKNAPTTTDPYAKAGLANAKTEVEGAIAALQADPPDNADAIKHKKNATGLLVAVIYKCLDTSKIIEELLKALQREGGISAAKASEINSLVQALLKLKKLGVFNQGDPAALMGQMAYKNAEAAIYEILFGTGDDGQTEKQRCFTWLIHSIMECWDSREVIDEVLDAMVKEGIITPARRAQLKKKIDAMMAAKAAGASGEDLLAMDQAICSMLWRPDETPPESHIIAPASGATIGGEVHLQAEQTGGDDGTLVKWQVTNNNGKKYVGGSSNVQSFFDVTFDTPTVPDGEYDLECWMYDDWGNFSINRQMLTIFNAYVNEPPVAVPGGPYEMDCEEPLALDGSGSYDPNAPADSIVSFEWDLDNDGLFDDASGETLSVPAEHFDPGSDPFDGIIYYCGIPFTTGTPHTVSLQVTDTSGATHADSTSLTIYDNRPFAAMTIDPSPAICKELVTLDASGSTHGRPDRAIVKYEWDFEGDGIVDYTETPSSAPDSFFDGITTHIYETCGDFNATVTITDDNVPAKTDTILIPLAVDYANLPPEAHANGPYEMECNEPLSLDGSGSCDPNEDCGDYIVSYEWDFNIDSFFDVTFDVPVTPPVPWSDLQGYGFLIADPDTGLPKNDVMLRVTDTHGDIDTAMTTVTVYDNRPFAVGLVDPELANCGETVTFDATGSYHGRPDMSIVRYEWDFADGTLLEGPVVTRPFYLPGPYIVNLTVTDDNVPAKTDTAILLFNITSTGPVLAPMSNLVVAEGSPLDIDEPFTNADETDTHTGSIGWGDEPLPEPAGISEHPTGTGTAGTINGTHVYGDNGSFVVTVTVEDDDGETDVETPTVTVTNVPPIIESMPPMAVFEDIEIPFVAYFNDPGYLDTHTAEIDWGDGLPPEEMVVNGGGGGGGACQAGHVYSEAGEYTATVSVTDDDGDTGTTTVEITVRPNTPPVAIISGPNYMDKGDALVLDGSGSYDPDAPADSIVQYEWDYSQIDSFFDVWGEASVTPPIPWPDLEEEGFLVADPDTGLPKNEIVLRVTDTHGDTDTTTSTVTVYDNQPFASFLMYPNPAACGQVLTFDATSSYHGRPDRSIVSYAWDFGDGSTAAGSTVSHAYSMFGSYTVTLTVTDNNSPAKTDTATSTMVINQGNRAPVADPGGPYDCDLGAGLTLDGSGSSDPDSGCGDSIVLYSWTIDGTITLTGTAPSLTASQIDLLGEGSHSVSLTVTDTFGATNTASTTLYIYDNQPFAVGLADPDVALIGQPVTFDASGSHHGSPYRQIVEYEWEFADGIVMYGPLVLRSFFDTGLYAVSLTVTDDSIPAKTDTILVPYEVIDF